MPDDDPRAPRPAAPVEPAVIPADTKDWTWVLDRACPECGFVAADVDPVAIGKTVRALTPRWQAALARPDARVRPDASTWSAVEYAAHVRDVNRVFADRLRSMLDADDPDFANWDQDAAARAGRYDRQEPATVAVELETSAAALAAAFDAVRPDQLDRSGRRSNGSVFTVRTLGQYYLHDVVHHLHDVDA